MGVSKGVSSRSTVLSPSGQRFYVEPAMDFSPNGAMVVSHGWYAGPIHGRHAMGGQWFPTREAAIDAIAAHKFKCPIGQPGCTSNCGAYGCKNITGGESMAHATETR
jgi:hypothetical protein